MLHVVAAGQEPRGSGSTLQWLRAAGNPETIVGSQGRCNPVILKVKELVGTGMIGSVLSCSVHSAAGNMGQIDASEMVGSLNPMNDSRLQTTMLMIHFDHLMDCVLYALGGVLPKSAASTASAASGDRSSSCNNLMVDSRTWNTRRQTESSYEAILPAEECTACTSTVDRHSKDHLACRGGYTAKRARSRSQALSAHSRFSWRVNY